MLVNLLTNAIKYNRVGGEVEVAVTGDEAGAQLAVADSGRGVTLRTPAARCTSRSSRSRKARRFGSPVTRSRRSN